MVPALRWRSAWLIALMVLPRLAAAEPAAPAPADVVGEGPAVADPAPPESTPPESTPPESTPPDSVPPEPAAADVPTTDEAAAPVEPTTGIPETDPPLPESTSGEASSPPAPVLAAPPPPPPPPPPAPPLAPRRGPFGLSGPATRTLGWVTFALSTAAGIGLTAAGIAACNGEGLDCIQGQPLIWSGAVVGLGGIPLGLSLIVRGGQLSVAGPSARQGVPRTF